MPGHHAILDFRWVHVNADHIGNLPAAIITPRARHTGAMSTTQTSNELAP
ncbi:hypothetical protein PAMC26577_00040 [Caballeronia sordidicola]|uniref:Uncharacterized protein n=1 Tax=Caballeronia sordidicola TaxID=196367 RepID=A0A242N7Z5_CABSO|nr:hypothetical protein PAMC26577_00040 [Caballeronia sordidicola]